AIDAGVAPATARRWVDPVLATLTRVKVLDDALYAEHRAKTLHRRGRSTRLIARDLELKAAPKPAIDTALSSLADDGATDFRAAVLLAKKKRLGPFGSPSTGGDKEARLKLRAKQLGALARAGFSFEIARRVVDAPSRESLEEG
ncbi:MAG TPA: RecX family transcriptional regulator, partial [Myxococcota bacterium]|nr:RecX family transcriptional regulator [Myxococcota bacterium]